MIWWPMDVMGKYGGQVPFYLLRTRVNCWSEGSARRTDLLTMLLVGVL